MQYTFNVIIKSIDDALANACICKCVCVCVLCIVFNVLDVLVSQWIDQVFVFGLIVAVSFLAIFRDWSDDDDGRDGAVSVSLACVNTVNDEYTIPFGLSNSWFSLSFHSLSTPIHRPFFLHWIHNS